MPQPPAFTPHEHVTAATLLADLEQRRPSSILRREEGSSQRRPLATALDDLLLVLGTHRRARALAVSLP